MTLFSAINPAEVVSTIFYTALGVGLMGLCWWGITRIAPFPVVKEIEEDQNTALAILIGALFLSLAIIIAAVILS
ncbi:MAG: DUF350 domain-containing protein [Paenirhodobacter sp.]|uniref:DUF350 domain-containing protein n=1 Tax=Paenirhodobacter sp. TaxID=1965326 RepID=UPI003D109E53